MLLRQTIRYLPAQIVPAMAQFASLALWSHFASAEVIGIVTLVVSMQELLVLTLMGLWTTYTVRFATAGLEDEAAVLRMRRTSTVVVAGATIVQALIGVGFYCATIGPPPPGLLVALSLAVGGRAFNAYQAERARATGDVLLYSIEVMAGPVIGAAAGVAMLAAFGSDALWIFAGYAVAQLIAGAFGLLRDRSWIALGRPDRTILIDALGYGFPVIVSALFAWITQNVARLVLGSFAGLSAAGIYALGFGLGFRAAQMVALAITVPAFPLAVRYANAGDDAGAMRQLASNATLLLAALAAGMAGLALVTRDVLGLFVAAAMRGPVYPVMLWTLLAGSAVCLRQHCLNQIFLLKARTRPIAMVALAEVPVAIVLALLTVPRWGAAGGAAALAATSLGSMIAMLVLGMRAGFRMPWADVLRIAIATGAMVAAVSATPPAQTLGALAIRIGICALAFIAAIALAYRTRIAALLRPWPVRRAAVVEASASA